MSIEVKQMLVKSTVLSGRGTETITSNRVQPVDLAEVRLAILNECRQMIADVLREQQER